MDFATLEITLMEAPKKGCAKSDAVEAKSTMLTVQVLWACHAFNATSKEAAQQIVADRYAHLSRGSSVSVLVQNGAATVTR